MVEIDKQFDYFFRPSFMLYIIARKARASFYFSRFRWSVVKNDITLYFFWKGSLSMGDTQERIENHPILGTYEKGKPVTFTYDGKEMTGFEGEPIAMALKANGVMVHRYTAKKHLPRGIFCAIGRCTDCVMVVDGEPNVRTCMTPLKEGMDVRTQYGVSDKPFDEQ